MFTHIILAILELVQNIVMMNKFGEMDMKELGFINIFMILSTILLLCGIFHVYIIIQIEYSKYIERRVIITSFKKIKKFINIRPDKYNMKKFYRIKYSVSFHIYFLSIIDYIKYWIYKSGGDDKNKLLYINEVKKDIDYFDRQNNKRVHELYKEYAQTIKDTVEDIDNSSIYPSTMIKFNIDSNKYNRMVLDPNNNSNQQIKDGDISGKE